MLNFGKNLWEKTRGIFWKISARKSTFGIRPYVSCQHWQCLIRRTKKKLVRTRKMKNTKKNIVFSQKVQQKFNFFWGISTKNYEKNFFPLEFLIKMNFCEKKREKWNVLEDFSHKPIFDIRLFQSCHYSECLIRRTKTIVRIRNGNSFLVFPL